MRKSRRDPFDAYREMVDELFVEGFLIEGREVYEAKRLHAAADFERRCGKSSSSNHLGEKPSLLQKKADDCDDDESFADRAVQAELDIAMGIHTDDEWMLP
jgi:hypothetical protein